MLHSPREAKTTTTTITYSKLSTLKCTFISACESQAALLTQPFRSILTSGQDGGDLGLVRSLRWMDIKGGAKKEASQSVGRKRKGGRGRCRKDHFDGHLETIQLCCGRTDGLSQTEGEKEDLGSDERRKELNWEQVRDGMRRERRETDSISFLVQMWRPRNSIRALNAFCALSPPSASA